MAKTVSSKYIQLQGFAGDALLEYEYNSAEISTRDANFIRVRNYYTGTMGYFNHNPDAFNKADELTGNVLDRTVQQIDDSKWVHLDHDRPLKYFERTALGANGAPVLRFDELWKELNNEIIVTYDTIKIHFQQGYNFEDLAGVIIRVSYLERSGTNQVFVLNYAYLKENDNIHLNPEGIWMGEVVYNRYIEVKIPSLRDLADTNNDLGPVFSSDGNGFLDKFPDHRDAKINFIAYEIKKLENASDGQLYLYTLPPQGALTNGIVRVEIPQVDSYSHIGARVQESDAVDGIEFYPTYNGNFLEDFVAERARLGENLLVIHDLEVIEHIVQFGGDIDELKTTAITLFQETEYDRPFYHRPIIFNNAAAAYTVQYTCRILNKNDNSQIIRRASITNTNPRKYGRRLTKINIQEGLQPIKIVNKIVVNSMDGRVLGTANPYAITGPISNRQTGVPTQIKTVFAPIQMADISVNASTLFVNNVGKVTYEADPRSATKTQDLAQLNLEELMKSDVIYGQGESVIYLNKFDNFFKFRFFHRPDKSVSQPQVYETLKDGPKTKFYLVFEDSSGELHRFESFDSDSNILISSGPGELVFRVDGRFSDKILQGRNRNFYITMENTVSEPIRGTDTENVRKDLEVILYRGVFDSIDNFRQVNHVNYLLKERLLLDRIAQIDSKSTVLAKLTEDFANLMGNIREDQLTSSAQELFEKFKAELDQLKNS